MGTNVIDQLKAFVAKQYMLHCTYMVCTPNSVANYVAVANGSSTILSNTSRNTTFGVVNVSPLSDGSKTTKESGRVALDSPT